MISASMHSTPYQTLVSNGRNALVADTKKEDIGGHTGFKPQELLEAALAACTNLTLRIASEKLGIPVTGIETTAHTDTATRGLTRFVLNIDLQGDLSEAQRSQLLKSARLCPVSQMLSGSISIVAPGRMNPSLNPRKPYEISSFHYLSGARQLELPRRYTKTNSSGLRHRSGKRSGRVHCIGDPRQSVL
jgi:putative redox protein